MKDKNLLQLRSKTPDYTADLINERLEESARSARGKKLRQDIKYIIEDPVFQNNVTNARLSLGLKPTVGTIDPRLFSFTAKHIDIWKDFDFLEDELSTEKWLINKIIADENHPPDSDPLAKYLTITSDATLQSELPYGWAEWVAAYIATNRIPQEILPGPDPCIKVLGVSEDETSLYIQLDKGMSSEEYKAAWVVFKHFLKQKTNTLPTAEQLKGRIYLDSVQNGLSSTKIAKKYFPYEFQRDRILTTDKVLKILKRFKR